MSTGELLNDIAATAQSVGLAIGPLTVLFLVFHLFFLKLPLQEVARVLAGSALAAVGLDRKSTRLNSSH